MGLRHCPPACPSLSMGLGGVETTVQKYKLFPIWQKKLFRRLPGRTVRRACRRVGQGSEKVLRARCKLLTTSYSKHLLERNRVIVNGYACPCPYQSRIKAVCGQYDACRRSSLVRCVPMPFVRQASAWQGRAGFSTAAVRNFLSADGKKGVILQPKTTAVRPRAGKREPCENHGLTRNCKPRMVWETECGERGGRKVPLGRRA